MNIVRSVILPSWSRLLGVLIVLAVSVAYCLPQHPSVHLALWDAVSHIALFLGLAAVLVPIRRPVWTLAALAVLGVVLEVIQWRVAGFAHLEWKDIASNETGVALAAVVAVLRKRARSHTRPSHSDDQRGFGE